MSSLPLPRSKYPMAPLALQADSCPAGQHRNRHLCSAIPHAADDSTPAAVALRDYRQLMSDPGLASRELDAHATALELLDGLRALVAARAPSHHLSLRG